MRTFYMYNMMKNGDNLRVPIYQSLKDPDILSQITDFIFHCRERIRTPCNIITSLFGIQFTQTMLQNTLNRRNKENFSDDFAINETNKENFAYDFDINETNKDNFDSGFDIAGTYV